LVITANTPPAHGSVSQTPSITHISHSGLSRSSGAVAMCPHTSANSRRPPGDGRPQQMPIDVERLVLNPHRIVQIELAVGQLCPELRYRRDP
jgi:hypothetical protein